MHLFIYHALTYYNYFKLIKKVIVKKLFVSEIVQFPGKGHGHYSDCILMIRIRVQVTIYSGLQIGRDGISANPNATIYRNLYENTGPVC